MEIADMQTGLEKIATLSENAVGPTEENVKQKIVVPLLEWLGHKREDMEFEYRTKNGGKIDIFLGKSLPKDCKVIIDTKNYCEELDYHVDQIKEYAFDEAALLAVLANGVELRTTVSCAASPLNNHCFIRFREKTFARNQC